MDVCCVCKDVKSTEAMFIVWMFVVFVEM